MSTFASTSQRLALTFTLVPPPLPPWLNTRSGEMPGSVVDPPDAVLSMSMMPDDWVVWMEYQETERRGL